MQIIFAATTHEEYRSTKVVKHLLAVDSKNDARFNTKVLEDWYLAEIETTKPLRQKLCVLTFKRL